LKTAPPKKKSTKAAGETVELPAKRNPQSPTKHSEPEVVPCVRVLLVPFRTVGLCCVLALALFAALSAFRLAPRRLAQEVRPQPAPERLESIVDPLLSIESGLGCNVAEMEPEPEADVPQSSYEAFQDAMEGVSGLVRRLERLQPLLGRPGGGHEAAAEESQRLRQRFAELLVGLRSAGASGESLVSRAQELGLFAFHRDLALFVGRLEGKLGIAGPAPAVTEPMPMPAPAVSIAQFGSGRRKSVASGGGGGPPSGPTPVPGRPGGAGEAAAAGKRAAAVGPVTPRTAKRVHVAMTSIVAGMQRFEALQPRVRLQPGVVVDELARRGQQLDEVLFSLQRRGQELVGEGSRPVHEAEGGRYATQLEALAEAQAGFLRETEERLLSGGEAPPAVVGQALAS